MSYGLWLLLVFVARAPRPAADRPILRAQRLYDLRPRDENGKATVRTQNEEPVIELNNEEAVTLEEYELKKWLDKVDRMTDEDINALFGSVQQGDLKNLMNQPDAAKMLGAVVPMSFMTSKSGPDEDANLAIKNLNDGIPQIADIITKSIPKDGRPPTSDDMKETMRQVMPIMLKGKSVEEQEKMQKMMDRMDFNPIMKYAQTKVDEFFPAGQKNLTVRQAIKGFLKMFWSVLHDGKFKKVALEALQPADPKVIGGGKTSLGGNERSSKRKADSSDGSHKRQKPK